MAAFVISSSAFFSKTGDWVFNVGDDYVLLNPNKNGAIVSLFNGDTSVINLAGIGSFFLVDAPAGLRLTTSLQGFTAGSVIGGSPTFVAEIAGQSSSSILSGIPIPDGYSYTLAWAGLIRVTGHTGAFPDEMDFQANHAQITGNYVLEFSSISMSPSTPVKIGDTITISANDKLQGATEIDLDYIDSNNVVQTITVLAADFVTQTPTQITFLVPTGFGTFAGRSYVTIIGNGVQFSGSVWLGPLTIYYADHSGIYVLTSGQRHDVLYEDHEGVGPETVNVKIPNPFYKTAYLPPQ